MSEVIKPIWIDGYYDNKALARHAAQQGITGTGLEGVPLQALTLDQIEALLKPLLIVDGLEERRELEKLCFADDDYWASRTAGGFVDWYARHLLARVQEWKGNTNP